MSQSKRSKPVPKSRASRLFRIARMASGVATGALAERGRQLAKGQRPPLKDLVLSPANAKRVTRQLSDMRGAAMKLGQIMSMEGSSIVPPQLAEILADLRSNATAMPATQLHSAMSEGLGANWRNLFASFANKPIASASIGQVHRAVSLEGKPLAIKVQYPGIADSISSDVDNLSSLLNISGLIPKQIELKPFLDEAKKLLHQEADYLTEAKYLEIFGSALKDDDRFVIPEYHQSLSSKNVLAMDYIDGLSIEYLQRENQSHIDRAITNLFDLLFIELFDLNMVQTDPNFANYRYQIDDDDNLVIGLLDFGAAQRFSKTFAKNYLKLVKAVIDENNADILQTAEKLGYELENASESYQKLVLDIFYLVLEPFAQPDGYDFSTANLSERVAELAQEANQFKRDWTTPPTAALYLHRKLGGLYMLAERLGANVDLNALFTPFLEEKRQNRFTAPRWTH